MKTTIKPQVPQIKIPSHLPERLAICFYVWNWIFEYAYAGLYKVMRWTVPPQTAIVLSVVPAYKRRLW